METLLSGSGVLLFLGLLGWASTYPHCWSNRSVPDYLVRGAACVLVSMALLWAADFGGIALGRAEEPLFPAAINRAADLLKLDPRLLPATLLLPRPVRSLPAVLLLFLAVVAAVIASETTRSGIRRRLDGKIGELVLEDKRAVAGSITAQHFDRDCKSVLTITIEYEKAPGDAWREVAPSTVSATATAVTVSTRHSFIERSDPLPRRHAGVPAVREVSCRFVGADGTESSPQALSRAFTAADGFLGSCELVVPAPAGRLSIVAEVEWTQHAMRRLVCLADWPIPAGGLPKGHMPSAFRGATEEGETFPLPSLASVLDDHRHKVASCAPAKGLVVIRDEPSLLVTLRALTETTSELAVAWWPAGVKASLDAVTPST
jgi:hypothetical protein